MRVHCNWSFAGDIASTSDGWQRYGIHLGGEDDHDMGDFAFYPKLFIQPLRKKIEAQLQFQEMMSVSSNNMQSFVWQDAYCYESLRFDFGKLSLQHSQLFIEYVTTKRRNWMSRRQMARGEVGMFSEFYVLGWYNMELFHPSCFEANTLSFFHTWIYQLRDGFLSIGQSAREKCDKC